MNSPGSSYNCVKNFLKTFPYIGFFTFKYNFHYHIREWMGQRISLIPAPGINPSIIFLIIIKIGIKKQPFLPFFNNNFIKQTTGFIAIKLFPIF